MLYVGMVAVAALGLWGAIDPRGQWHAMAAWQFRDPEANEPSDAAYLLTRLSSATLALLMLGGVVLLAATGT